MNINYKPPEDANSDVKKFLKLWHSFSGGNIVNMII